MRLVVVLAALLVAPPAAHAAEPVTWEDPCGDAAPAVRVAGTPVPLPSVAGGEVDLRRVEVDATSADAVVIRFDLCASLRSGEGTFIDVEADLPDGCVLSLRWQDRVSIDVAGPEVRRMALAARMCDRDGALRSYDESAEVPFAVAGDRLTLTVPRTALSTGLARGTTLRGVVATATEVGAVPPPRVSLGTMEVLGGSSRARDTAAGPAALVLD